MGRLDTPREKELTRSSQTTDSRYKAGCIGALVLAALLSTTLYLCRSLTGPRTISDTFALESYDSRLPQLPRYQLDEEIANHLGAYSARYVVPSRISANLPNGCDITMINVLQRHGARYPTWESGTVIDAALAKTRAAQNVTDHILRFVSTFNYTYIPEQLVSFGRSQSYISGQIVARKYAALGTSKFIRTTDKERVVESSQWWRQGFEGGSFDTEIDSLPQPDLVYNTINNTLEVTTCVAAEALKPAPGSIASQKWISAFAPAITTRLNKLLPGANLNNNDTVALMSLCGFDTAARNGSASPWCNVFTKNEFRSFEYSFDLGKYYTRSYGSAYARSEGSGWVNELLSRLTGIPVHDSTTTNRTIDANMTTFPIGPSAPKIFADFSTDIGIAMILSALGILRDNSALPVTGPIPPSRQFYVSKIVPFGGSTVVEKITCPAKGATLRGGDYVRILVNDAIVPLDFLPCGDLGRTSGICSLAMFIESQAYARSGGNWTSCFTSNG